MPITKTSELYEILFRFEAGSIKGCHAQYLETVSEDGVVLAQKLGQALPVSTLTGAAGLTVAKVLGEAMGAALAAKEAAECCAAEAEARAKVAEEKEAAAVAAAEPVINAAAQLEAKNAIIQDLMAQLAKV